MARSGLQGVKNWLLASILAPPSRGPGQRLFIKICHARSLLRFFSFRTLPIRDEWINRRKKIFIWKMFATRVAWMTAQPSLGPRRPKKVAQNRHVDMAQSARVSSSNTCGWQKLHYFHFRPSLQMVRRKLKLFISLFAYKYQETRKGKAIFGIRTSCQRTFYCQKFIEFW